MKKIPLTVSLDKRSVRGPGLQNKETEDGSLSRVDQDNWNRPACRRSNPILLNPDETPRRNLSSAYFRKEENFLTTPPIRLTTLAANAGVMIWKASSQPGRADFASLSLSLYSALPNKQASFRFIPSHPFSGPNNRSSVCLTIQTLWRFSYYISIEGSVLGHEQKHFISLFSRLCLYAECQEMKVKF